MGQAQQAPIDKYNIQNIPSSLTLLHGSILEIDGKLDANEPGSILSLRCSNQIRVSGTFNDKWALRWDTTNEISDVLIVSICQRRFNSREQTIKRFDVHIVNAPPARIVEPVDDTIVIRSTPVKILADKGNLTGVDLEIDGQGEIVKIGADGKGLWDAGQTSQGKHLLGGQAHLLDGSVFQLAPVSISVYGRARAVPFDFGDKMTLTSINGNFPLRAQIDPDIKIKQVDYLIDGKKTGERTEAPYGASWWDPAELRIGPHKYNIVVTDEAGEKTVSNTFEFNVTRKRRKLRPTEEYRAILSSSNPIANSDMLTSLLSKSDDKNLVYPIDILPARLGVVTGSKLVIAMHYEQNAKATFVLRDGIQLLDSISPKGDFYLSLDTSKLTLGSHPIRVLLEPNADPSPLAVTNLVVYEKPPVYLIPLEAKDLTQAVTLSVRSDTGFAISTVKYYLDGRLIPTNEESSKTAFWDIRNEAPGKCDLWAIVTGKDGSTVRTANEKITIPSRIVIQSPTGILKTSDPAPLTIKLKLAEGMNPSVVDYELDGKIFASRTEAPFDIANTNSVLLAAGMHTINIYATDKNGAKYKSTPCRFGISREADDLAKVEAEVAARQQLDTLEEKRRHSTDALRRRLLIAGNSLSSSTIRFGNIGSVNGLSVTSSGVLIKVGTDVQFVTIRKWGELLPIQARITSGTGRLIMHDRLDDQDPLVAARNALAYVKQKTANLFSIHWNLLDVHIGSSSSLPIGGPSAGAAYTTALMSFLLKRPVDVQTAITGTVDELGNVGPVGEVGLKAEGAFINQAIHTLIVPRHAESRSGIDSLFDIRPDLFVNRRLILVTRMEEVLRQALIGYDPKYASAETYVQLAIRDFVEGFDDDALEEFGQAHELTPENETIVAWIAGIKRAQREALPIKKP